MTRMVIAEKQNLQTDQQRHRRILDRMSRVLLGPRVNRPRPDSILRSMDLFGLDPESFVGDITSDKHVIESLFQDTLLQSFQDNIRPQRSHRVPGLDVLDGSPNNSQKFGSLSNSRRQNHMKSEPDVHIIPITFINDKKHVDKKDVQSAINISSQMDHDGIHTVSSSASDDDESCVPVVVIPDENSDICSLSNKSSMVRRSLPKRTQESKKKFVSKKDKESSISDIIVIDEPSVAKEPENQSIKNHRSNKDTLVGGANKVLADMGPNGFVTSENMDIPAGATYLTVKHGAVDISSPHVTDTLSNSEEEKPVNEVPNYPVYSILKLKLLKECRQIDYIKGDGNCFFRALSKQLYGSERFHIVVRNLIVDLIATNKSKFSQFVDGGDVQDHVERMSQEQSWATTCEIYAAATLLQRDIFMLTPDHLNETYSWLLFKPVFKLDCQQSNIESHPCYITLCNTNGNHYDRIVGEHGGCNCFLPHPELEGVIYNVDLT